MEEIAAHWRITIPRPAHLHYHATSCLTGGSIYGGKSDFLFPGCAADRAIRHTELDFSFTMLLSIRVLSYSPTRAKLAHTIDQSKTVFYRAMLLPHYIHHLTGRDPPVVQEPLGWERLGRTCSHRISGFTRYGGRQSREILGIRSSVYGNALHAIGVRHQEEEDAAMQSAVMPR